MKFGRYDRYLRSYADRVGTSRASRHRPRVERPAVLAGYGHLLPSTLAAALRHIVTLFRSEHRAGRLVVAWRAVCYLGRPINDSPAARVAFRRPDPTLTLASP